MTGSRLFALSMMAMLGCGVAPRARPRASEQAPPSVVTESFDDLPEGECGGFASLGESEPLALLAGRLRVRAPRGTVDSPRPHSIMAAPHAAEMESRLFLDHQGARFVVFAVELFRTPTDDLVAAARADAGDDYRVAPLELATPLRGAVAVPRELDLADDAVDVAIAYVVTDDDLVQRVAFYVTPDAAQDGGCRRLGLALARTLTAGVRRLPEGPGPRVLEGTLGIDVPADHRLVVQEGPDFTVYRVLPVLPLGGGDGGLGIYVGHHPSFEPPPDATRTPGTLLGQRMEWLDWSEDGALRRQALVPTGGHAYAHIFLSADDRATFDRLAAIAASLRSGVRAPPLAACPDAARLPAVEAHAEVLAIPALRTLLSADRFSVYRRTWDVARVDPTEAFFALAEHPRARDAFLHLAVHGTTAGRLYGLAGLYLQDGDAFDDVVCAVRDSIEPTVTVQLACGTEERPVAPMIEAADAVRGQPHWSAEQWARALHDAPVDLRGGGLAWRLALGPPDARSIEADAWDLGGEGYDPPLDPGDRRASTMPPFAPARDRRRLTATTQNGGVCHTRADGRVACWGSTPLSERRGAAMLPESVRWPSDLAVDLGLGCVLDAEGRRVCFALLEPALEARARACPSAPAPTQPVVRRFDDGPWRELSVGRSVCGIHADGSLRCFASSNRYQPEWAELDGVGVGTSYAIPIEGQVAGVRSGYLFDAYAWTTDGRIWKWDNDARPRVIGTIEGVVDVTAGNDGEVAFARTADGRVFVRGARSRRDGTVSWWSSFGDDEGPWVEVPALRGARVVLGDHHGCAIMPDRGVRCWGQRTGYAPSETGGSDYDREPQDVPELRGARELIVGEWLTCGELRAGAWRCIGAHLDGLTNGAVGEEHRAAVEVRPDRVAASIR